MDLGIAGRIALVTGADSGIGFHRAATAFLCSNRASFVNGSNDRVDAGSDATI